MDKRQARLVPDDLLSFIVVFISFVKRDEVFVKFNRNHERNEELFSCLKHIFIIHELFLKENISFRKKDEIERAMMKMQKNTKEDISILTRGCFPTKMVVMKRNHRY